MFTVPWSGSRSLDEMVVRSMSCLVPSFMSTVTSELNLERLELEFLSVWFTGVYLYVSRKDKPAYAGARTPVRAERMYHVYNMCQGQIYKSRCKPAVFATLVPGRMCHLAHACEIIHLRVGPRFLHLHPYPLYANSISRCLYQPFKRCSTFRVRSVLKKNMYEVTDLSFRSAVRR